MTQSIYAQQSASSTELKRYVSLFPCSSLSTSSNGVNTEKLLLDSKLLQPQGVKKSAFSRLDSMQRIPMIQDLEYFRFLLNRTELPIGKLELFRLENESVKYLAKSLPSLTSVGPGGDIRGGEFNPNKRVFVTRNSKGDSCWTYTEPAYGEQVFDYEGFEEVAVIYASQKHSCSAVIVGQNHALTARHCEESGLLLIPTKASRVEDSTKARKATGCSLKNQYNADCEFEVVSYKNVESFSPKSTQTIQLGFKSPIDDAINTLVVDGGKSFGTPDIRLISFKREKPSQELQKTLVTARIASYPITLANIDGVFSFVRAGYGYSLEPIKPSLTIGSWQGKTAPVEPSRGVVLDTEEIYAYVALFHSAEQKSRICQGDSGGALFFGNPNGKEQKDQETQARILVGVISGAKDHTNANECLKSPVETSQIINTTLLKQICAAADSSIIGCKKQ